MGENFKAPNPFVTWQFTQEDGKRDYYWGHYFNGECEAIGDYNRRVFSYEKQYDVSRLETSGPDFFKYYSTQRPVDIATYPRPKDNLPVAHLNYNTRQPVEGESFRAWGELWYPHPLTEKQMADYEIKKLGCMPETLFNVKYDYSATLFYKLNDEQKNAVLDSMTTKRARSSLEITLKEA